MNVAASRPIIIDEEQAMLAGLIDPAVPVVPAIEITFGVPVQVSPALFRPPPCAKPVEFLGHLAQVGSMADNAFGDRWNTRAPFTGPAGDDLLGHHAAINAAGKLLFTALSHALGDADLPQYRFVLNRVENAWLDFNAHACRTSPPIELWRAGALQDEVAAISTALASLPPTSPDWASPGFLHTCKTMLLGARLTRMEAPLRFEFAGIPVPVMFEGRTSPVIPCGTLCTIADQMCDATIHLLESLGTPETIPDDHRKLRDAFWVKVPRLPTEPPQFYVARHYQVKSTHKRLVPLEEGDEADAILDLTLPPGKGVCVSITAWETETLNIARTAAYPDTPLPEARDDILRRIRSACEKHSQGDPNIPQDGRTLLVRKNLPGGIPRLIQDAIRAQSDRVNGRRTFVVQKIPSSKRDQCQPGGQPTNPRKVNALYFKNKGQIPLRVRYIPAQKTYTITISFAKAGLLCFDGASWKKAGREKWPRALSALLNPTASIEDTPFPAAMRHAELEGRTTDSSLTFDVVLRKPVAAPLKFIETHVKEFPRKRIPARKRASGGSKAKKGTKQGR